MPIEIEDFTPRTDIDPTKMKEIIDSKDFKAKDGSSPESIIAGLVKENPKSRLRSINKKSLENLRQYSQKQHDEKAKINSLKNLRPLKPSNEEEPAPEDSQDEKVEKKPNVAIMPKDEIELPASISPSSKKLIKECLTKEELAFFIERWHEYWKEYGSTLNNANDQDQLIELIMLHVDLYRLRRKEFTTPRLTTDPAIDKIKFNISKKIESILTAFGSRRKDRMDAAQGAESNFIALLTQKAKQLSIIKTRVLEEAEEEERFMREKSSKGMIEYGF